MMNAIKSGANFVIKKVSDFGSKAASAEVMSLNQEKDKLIPIIEQSGKALQDLSELKVDIGVLRILLQNVRDIYTNVQRLVSSMDDVDNDTADQISSFYNVKLLLQNGSTKEAMQRFDAAIDQWQAIITAADSLEQTYMASF